MFNTKVLSIGYITSVVLLFLYSFTQVDLGLTLTRWEMWQGLQQAFQHIGYFNRPLSTYFYLGILFLLFLSYFLLLQLAKKGKVSFRQAWLLITATAIILAFSYNAFSHDLFNYIFDAKIVTNYQQNPYEHKALDFPNDPMLSFMHWTHRVYPYGPVWLGLTIPLSFFGMQLLLPTMLLFKAFTASAFVGSAYIIGKILRKISPQEEILGILFFGLNPLIIIESLVSSHNDIVMVFFALFGLHLLVAKRNVLSIFLLLLSIGVKFATVFLAPIFLYAIVKKNNVNFEKMFVAIVVAMAVGVITASLRTNFQPWYLVFVIPFAALVPRIRVVFISCFVLSVFALLEYVPYLYLGNWDPPVPTILFWLTATGVIVSVLLATAQLVKKGK